MHVLPSESFTSALGMCQTECVWCVVGTGTLEGSPAPRMGSGFASAGCPVKTKAKVSQ